MCCTGLQADVQLATIPVQPYRYTPEFLRTILPWLSEANASYIHKVVQGFGWIDEHEMVKRLNPK